ncbi:hypothetical protein B0J13DRAFT_196485 [Dactylonectria estremocensis]|uniref:Zn(2)-C6 fungal-type domain-containing protein n=1 Tax=Dactylonectria estremocensis TaxID=1079267 RepID=A0A9P9DH96_9HYPO|nr:hypothetical protein B0J13DRAFT_196485 [Dactylonectria estremocensis]
MTSKRPVKSCDRCRRLKIRCDRAKPACNRCSLAGSECNFLSDSLGLPTEVPTPLDVFSSTSSESTPATSDVTTDNGLTDQPASSCVPLKPNEPKKRNRASLSCVRCRRLKVKCDKAQPCSRCSLSGWTKSCTYTHRIRTEPDSNTLDTDFVHKLEDPCEVVPTWHARYRGLGHWKSLLLRFGSIADVQSPPFVMAAEEIARTLHECESESHLPANYPHNSPGAVAYMSLDKVRDLIKNNWDNQQSFIDQYMHMYQCIHPILNAPEFMDQAQQFWDEPCMMDISWLAMYLMVLGLGSLTLNEDPALAKEFFMSAEACISKTPFTFRPTITSLRTLCLMVVAKQVHSMTCWAMDSCWSFMGTVMRLALLNGLHRRANAPEGHTQSLEDAGPDQDLWMTILYFSVQTSIVTGMPNLLDTSEIFPIHVTTRCEFGEYGKGSPWYRILRTSSKTVMDIMSKLNSDVKPSYNEVATYNAELRQLMSMLDNVRMGEIQRIALDIYFRRLLLVLHRPFALDQDAQALYPLSYWVSLECSLAFLVHHRDLCDMDRQCRNLVYIARLFLLDFFSAAVTTCVHLLRKDAPLAYGYGIPPRKTILDTLQACTDLWARDRDKSVCFRTGVRLLESLMAFIQKRAI